MSIEALKEELAGLPQAERGKIMAFMVALHKAQKAQKELLLCFLWLLRRLLLNDSCAATLSEGSFGKRLYYYLLKPLVFSKVSLCHAITRIRVDPSSSVVSHLSPFVSIRVHSWGQQTSSTRLAYATLSFTLLIAHDVVEFV